MLQINPYQYTLPTPSSMFVGRWTLVDELMSSLCGPQLDSWIVIGGRRFGKSSVLKAVETRLTDRLVHRTLSDWCIFPVVINLQGAETESVQQVYAYILMRLYDALCEHTVVTVDLVGTQLHTLALREVEKLTFRSFEQALKDLIKHFESRMGPTRFVLLLDEVEHATNFPWHITLFSQLRSLIYDSPLVGIVKLVLTGSTRVVQVRETGSPFLNALQLHYLEPSDPTVSSEAREKADRNGKRIDEQPFEHIKANPENTKITAVGTINEMTKAQLDGLCAKGQQGDIEQSNGQGESGDV